MQAGGFEGRGISQTLLVGGPPLPPFFPNTDLSSFLPIQATEWRFRMPGVFIHHGPPSKVRRVPAAAGKETAENLRDVVGMLKNSRNSQVNAPVIRPIDMHLRPGRAERYLQS